MSVDLPLDVIEVSPDGVSSPVALSGCANAPLLDAPPGKKSESGVAAAAKSFVCRAVRRLFKLRVVDIVVLDFAPLCRRPAEPAAFDFRFLSAAEIRAAIDDPTNDIEAEMFDRLALGRSCCLAALDHGRLANYSWYALGQIEPEYSFGIGLTLPEDVVFMYKAFTMPAYRGRRLHQATVYRAAQIFAGRGARRMIALVECSNRASWRSHQRMGCRWAGRFVLIGSRLVLWRCEASLARLTPWRPPDLTLPLSNRSDSAAEATAPARRPKKPC